VDARDLLYWGGDERGERLGKPRCGGLSRIFDVLRSSLATVIADLPFAIDKATTWLAVTHLRATAQQQGRLSGKA